MSVLAESELQIEANALAVRAVGEWLTACLAVLQPQTGSALFARAELAVHEACMNVIDHANLPGGSTLALALALTDENLTVRVSDSGEPFDLAAVPIPDPHVLQPRGYGVKIIRALVSDLSYRRLESSNELSLRFDFEVEA